MIAILGLVGAAGIGLALYVAGGRAAKRRAGAVEWAKGVFETLGPFDKYTLRQLKLLRFEANSNSPNSRTYNGGGWCVVVPWDNAYGDRVEFLAAQKAERVARAAVKGGEWGTKWRVVVERLDALLALVEAEASVEEHVWLVEEERGPASAWN